ncbi:MULTISPECIES: hypothetical protein [unclassified Streptomyces]|uniref:hypothetical protein n=1 Tax=unclassified Streptomyces TaxID=2593676 RepID=UPI000748667C|nr:MULTISPECIES: hypothetical protein [unclassified Streptomyces]KUL49334.1 hypothetical protein ADL30_34230 [Streptomyces sp. NRRL S-1521]THC52622.1 hypothetical protein E7X58_11640 [Streptomyces sp. A1499]
MSVDPTDPETFETEENTTAETAVEAPEADTAEQQADLAPSRDDSLKDADPGAASEADLAEQARVVTIDEDDYR